MKGGTMKAINIVPVDYLHLIKDDEMHMVLAQHVRMDEEEQTVQEYDYTEFYRQQASMGKHIIMDNGACEGALVDFELVIQRAQYINAAEIVLPDIFNNMQQTKDAILLGLQTAHDLGVFYDFKWMAVCHGRNETEVSMMMHFINTLPVSTVGIPKVLSKNFESNSVRVDVVAKAYVENIWMNKEIHFLGSTDEPLEVLQASKWNSQMMSTNQGIIDHHEYIRSVDSAVPFIFAKADMLFCDGTRPNEKINFMSDPISHEKESALKLNMQQWNNYASGRQETLIKKV
jgi:hypothetical protein